jgi:hypothetical protein
MGFTSSVDHRNGVGGTRKDAQAAPCARISNDFRFPVAFNRHQGAPYIHEVKLNRIIIAHDGALVTTDALAFLNKGHGAFTTLGVGSLLTSLAVQRRSYL